jgi:hypothetical protein
MGKTLSHFALGRMFLILPMAYDREKAQSTVAGPMSLTKSTSYNMHVAKLGVAANTKD